MRSRIGVAALGILSFLSPAVIAQPTDRKASTLRGTVEQVSTATKRLTVANEPIPGGMGAMTMSYAVDNADLLSRVKPGDHITAKMYEGDMTLYDVQVVSSAAGSPQGSAAGIRLEDLETIALADNPTLA